MPLCIAGYYLMPRRFRNVFLLLASLVFYSFGELDRMYILVAAIVLNYLTGLIMSALSDKKGLRTAVLVLSLIYNAGILFGYKYLMYRYGARNVALPLGLSFFTFRTISYCLDVYWDMMPANKNILDVALYISFFPQISMGPISRYTELIKEIRERSFDAVSFNEGIRRIIEGLFKKLVIADTLLPAIDTCFALDASQRSVSFAWLGLFAFLIQLYFDFMGYTDIAIGLGKVFGFRLPENFDYPYAAPSVTEFWNRWHMTLGAWMKNYIYIPVFRLCQSRKLSKLTCYLISSLFVWLFVGAWHGVGMKTIYYGLYYYILIALERIVSDRKKARRKKLGIKKEPVKLSSKIGAHIYMLIAIIIGQLLFKCESMGQYGTYLAGMLGLSHNPLTQAETWFYLKQDIVPLMIGTVFSLPLFPVLMKKKAVKMIQPVLYLAMFVTALAFAFTSTYQSFVYFRF